MVADIWQRGAEGGEKRGSKRDALYISAWKQTLAPREKGWEKDQCESEDRHEVPDGRGILGGRRAKVSRSGTRAMLVSLLSTTRTYPAIPSTVGPSPRKAAATRKASPTVCGKLAQGNEAGGRKRVFRPTTCPPSSSCGTDPQKGLCRRSCSLNFPAESNVREDQGSIAGKDCCGGCNPRPAPTDVGFPREMKQIRPEEGSIAGMAIAPLSTNGQDGRRKCSHRGLEMWPCRPPGPNPV